ncbi:LysR family transcriptional regulator [Companilactobacillus metriopterae]|uniref:LysR family transcriptional regulator n=1 Tax=Companilactobacillus metriopterae TaxID=1909267 RepID=UPI00100A2854|nr:LysR family transcriptional regulator [Companilactobacillus metriopterae]
MELRILRYFITVASERNISHAAQVLSISQPSLSRQLNELESELGVKLFNRGSRQLTLTDQGQYFLSQSIQIINSVDETISNIQTNSDYSGDLFIGAGESPTKKFITDILTEINSDYPKIKFHVISGNADTMNELLSNGVLDFAIIFNPADKTKYDYLQIKSTDKWGILMRKDDPLSSKKHISPSDIKKRPLIISRQRLVRDQLSEFFGENIDNLNIVATYDLIYNASLMVESGLGLVIGFEGIINTASSNLQFVPLSGDFHSTSSVVWIKNSTQSEIAKLFIKKIKSTL